MNITERAQAILDTLNNADALTVDGGPLLRDYTLEDDSSAIVFNWMDGDGDECSERLLVAQLDLAEASPDGLTALNDQGEQVVLQALTVTPIAFAREATTCSDFVSFLTAEHGANLSRETLIEMLDELVYEAIVDKQTSRDQNRYEYQARHINNQGPEEQVKALIEHGSETSLFEYLLEETNTTAERLREFLYPAKA